MTWIQTFTGQAVDLLHPRPETIQLADIEHALARICRYTGHTVEHYSVAQHCVLVANHLQPELALQGLMHDAVEAYVQDVSAPLKWAMRELAHESPYDRIEHRVDLAIAKRFKLERPLPKEVRDADLRMLATEARALGFLEKAPQPWSLPLPPYDMEIECWSASRAKEEFHNRFMTASCEEVCTSRGVQAISVACPTCAASPGKLCENMKNDISIGFHDERKRAAYKAGGVTL